MNSLTLQKALRVFAVNALRTHISAAGPPTALMLLFTNSPAISENLTLGDLSEPTGSWYARALVTWSEVFIDPASNRLYIASGSVEFDYSGTDPSETIYGFAMIDTTGALVAVGMLDSPVVMANTLDAVITPVAAFSFPVISG